MESPRYTLNKLDVERVLKNAMVFAGPALLVLLASTTQIVPKDSQYAILVLYILNLLMDLLRKFLDGQPK